MCRYVSLRRPDAKLFYFKEFGGEYYLVNLGDDSDELVPSPLKTKKVVVIAESHTGHKRAVVGLMQNWGNLVNFIDNVRRDRCINLHFDCMNYSEAMFISRRWCDIHEVDHYGKCGYMALAQGKNYFTTGNVNGAETADTVIEQILNNAHSTAVNKEHTLHLSHLREHASIQKRYLPPSAYCTTADCKKYILL